MVTEKPFSICTIRPHPTDAPEICVGTIKPTLRWTQAFFNHSLSDSDRCCSLLTYDDDFAFPRHGFCSLSHILSFSFGDATVTIFYLLGMVIVYHHLAAWLFINHKFTHIATKLCDFVCSTQSIRSMKLCASQSNLSFFRSLLGVFFSLSLCRSGEVCMCVAYVDDECKRQTNPIDIPVWLYHHEQHS